MPSKWLQYVKHLSLIGKFANGFCVKNVQNSWFRSGRKSHRHLLAIFCVSLMSVLMIIMLMLMLMNVSPSNSQNVNDFVHVELRKDVAAKSDRVDLIEQRPKRPDVVDSIQAPKAITRDTLEQQKQRIVYDEFGHAWNAYKRHCWGHDELRPISKNCNDWMRQGLTIIDSLSTLWVLDMHEEFEIAKKWVETEFHPENGEQLISLFEAVIRIVGGLNSAYDLSGDHMFLEKSHQVATLMLPAFETPTGLPHSLISLKSGKTADYSWTNGVFLSEVGTLQVEFAYLSHHTGDMRFETVARRIFDHLDRLKKPLKGVYPVHISTNTGNFTSDLMTWGAMGDSFYEYTLKWWLLTGKKHDQYLRMYRESMDGMLEHLLTSGNGYTWIAFLEGNDHHKVNKMNHLACFGPALLALGVQVGAIDDIDEIARYMHAARELTKTCYHFYDTPSGLAPDQFSFDTGMEVDNPRYELRPEVLEALFMMWRTTKEQIWRDMAWDIFSKIMHGARVSDGGYSSTNDCRQDHSWADRMDSFFLAETMKYAFLIFSDDSLLPLWGEADQYYVLNTECHPVKVWH